jgi:hypothetical protein
MTNPIKSVILNSVILIHCIYFAFNHCVCNLILNVCTATFLRCLISAVSDFASAFLISAHDSELC